MTRKTELTPAELKKMDGFGQLTDEEARDTIQQLKELSFILYDAFQNEQQKQRQIKTLKLKDYEN